MTRTRAARGPLLAGAAVAALALLTACGGADDAAPARTSADRTSSAPTATATPEPSPSPTGDADDAPTAPPSAAAGTGVSTAAPSADAALTVTGVRVGHHDGFDRVVLELGGTGTPGWRVEYVDAAVADPSDEQVDLAGDSVLRVTVEGTVLPYETRLTEAPVGVPRTVAGGTAVAEAVYLGAFEAQSQALVGVTGDPRPYRVQLLADPVRVVVDVEG
ncbi:hypothetical protein [Cellulomonas sp. IC4_254]|uniref:AMIN-like domain-containing (lipo)protein n=1 Tax=Cellulomonas sp. IC4_254 TaxID=2714040 RepID=UPI001422053B|nr:hypothetical protein [Cellulomonas sp. IC4_254]NHT18036.1 hypothetical protein [Cellulomonas sp. IC4_254]